jgi:hypothetical protein
LLPPSPAAITTGLIPASGYQDATTSPSALMRLVFAHHRVHRIPLPTFVTTAKRPSFRKRDARKSARDLPDVTSESACDTLARRANQLEADNAAVKGIIFLCPGRGAAPSARSRASSTRYGAAPQRRDPCKGDKQYSRMMDPGSAAQHAATRRIAPHPGNAGPDGQRSHLRQRALMLGREAAARSLDYSSTGVKVA